MAGGQWKLSVYDPGTGGLIHGFFIKNSQMAPDSLQTFPASSAIIRVTCHTAWLPALIGQPNFMNKDVSVECFVPNVVRK